MVYTVKISVGYKTFLICWYVFVVQGTDYSKICKFGTVGNEFKFSRISQYSTSPVLTSVNDYFINILWILRHGYFLKRFLEDWSFYTRKPYRTQSSCPIDEWKYGKHILFYKYRVTEHTKAPVISYTPTHNKYRAFTSQSEGHGHCSRHPET